MFKLTNSPLEQLNLRDGLTSSRAGAFISFEGLVRNHSDGESVLKLEYEAAEALCLKEAEKILTETKEKFDIVDARVFHRTGVLHVGEMAVWVGVLASHRDDAFKACRYIIDQIKARLAIWKKEYYHSGDSGWVNSGQGSVAGGQKK